MALIVLLAGCSDSDDEVRTAASDVDATTPASTDATDAPATTIDPSIGFDDAEWYEITATAESSDLEPGSVGTEECHAIDQLSMEGRMRAGIQPTGGWAWTDSQATDVSPERLTDGTSVWVARDVAWDADEVDAAWVAVDAENDPYELVSLLDFPLGDLTPGLYMDAFLHSSPAQFWEQAQEDAVSIESVGNDEFEGVSVEKFELDLGDGATGVALVDESGAPRVFEGVQESTGATLGGTYRMEFRPGAGAFEPVPPTDAPALTDIPVPEPKLTVDCDVAEYLDDLRGTSATTAAPD